MTSIAKNVKFADHPQRDRIVASLRYWAAKHSEIARVIVYGSRARGDYRPESDLDVAVELSATSQGEEPFVIWISEASKWTSELSPSLPWPLDLQWRDRSGETPTVTGKIEKGHFIAYERDTL